MGGNLLEIKFGFKGSFDGRMLKGPGLILSVLCISDLLFNYQSRKVNISPNSNKKFLPTSMFAIVS